MTEFADAPNPNQYLASPALIRAMAARHIEDLNADLAAATASFGGPELYADETLLEAATIALEDTVLPVVRGALGAHNDPIRRPIFSQPVMEILAGHDDFRETPGAAPILQDVIGQMNTPKGAPEPNVAFPIARRRLETAAAIAAERSVPIETVFEQPELFAELMRATYETPVEFAAGRQKAIALLGPDDVEDVFYTFMKSEYALDLADEQARLGVPADEDAEQKALLAIAEEYAKPEVQAEVPRIVMLARAFATQILASRIERYWGSDVMADMPPEWQQALLPRLDPAHFIGLHEDRTDEDELALGIARTLAVLLLSPMFG